MRKAEDIWGVGIVEQVSLDLGSIKLNQLGAEIECRLSIKEQ